MTRLYVVRIALLILLTGCLEGETQEAQEELVAQPASSIAKGKITYASNCRVCHSPDGKGVPGIGAAELISPRVKALGRERKIAQVTNGGMEMPLQKRRLGRLWST